MTYFEKSLADTAKRKGNGFIIKADPKKVEHNYRLPLLPEIETSNTYTRNNMKWISVEERLPPNMQIVLCGNAINTFVAIGRYDEFNEKFLLIGKYYENDEEFLHIHEDADEIDSLVTHWMPLPKPPEDNNNTKQ